MRGRAVIRALIVDDEPLSRRAVRQLCARRSDVVVVAECRNAAEAGTVLRRSSIDVMFLDVRMPGLTGLDVARRREHGRPLVVFVTAFQEFAFPAFDTGAVDYLTKPLNPARFDRALARVKARLALTASAAPRAEPAPYEHHLVVRLRDREVILPAESIEYIAAEDVYAAVHSLFGVHLIRQSLDALEERLDPGAFVRVHRSFIVQIDYVLAIRRTRRDRRMLVLRSGAEVPVSRHRRAAMQRLRSSGT
jgi:two-component system LytT family response regulator